MSHVEVGRYRDQSCGYAGWIAPEVALGEVPPWALFVLNDGALSLSIRDEHGNLESAWGRHEDSPPRTFTLAPEESLPPGRA